MPRSWFRALGPALLALAMIALPASAEPLYSWDWADGPSGAHTYSAAPVAARAGAEARACWQTRAPIYRHYLVAFCTGSGGQGAYRVRGEGYECTGRSSWRHEDGGGRIVYQMARGSCGPRADWTADRMVCEPARRRGGRLECTYHPNAEGYGPERFTAFRH